MNLTELAVIAFGLFAGYWVVSKLLFNSKPKPVSPPKPVSDSQEKPWHEVLEVAPDADMDAIHAAHQRLISLYHPDKVASLGRELQDLATTKAQAINAAYERALEARKAAS